MKLYYSPGACSIGIHALLEEIGKPYQLEQVNLREGAQFKPPYTAVTPKAKVPALERDDGSVLTEFPVIARWLGREVIEKGFAVLDEALAGKNYIAGNEFSPADTALFYCEFWAAKRLNMKLPANVAAHYDRMMARPSVQRVMQQEGLN